MFRTRFSRLAMSSQLTSRGWSSVHWSSCRSLAWSLFAPARRQIDESIFKLTTKNTHKNTKMVEKWKCTICIALQVNEPMNVLIGERELLLCLSWRLAHLVSVVFLLLNSWLTARVHVVFEPEQLAHECVRFILGVLFTPATTTKRCSIQKNLFITTMFDVCLFVCLFFYLISLHLWCSLAASLRAFLLFGWMILFRRLTLG